MANGTGWPGKSTQSSTGTRMRFSLRSTQLARRELDRGDDVSWHKGRAAEDDREAD
jgi:hypothetical protein